MHRRSFLKLGIAAGSLIAASPLHASGFSVGAGYCAQAVAFFNRLATAPTTARAKQLDILFRSLVDSGVFPLLDTLWVLAAADAATAVKNLVSTSFSLTAVNSPAFVADRGYTGDGATSCLTGPNLSTFGGQYALNDCHMGVFCGTNVSENTVDCGVSGARVSARNASTTAQARGNDATSTSQTLASNTSIGHTMFSRSLSTAYVLYKNGAALGTTTVTTTSITNGVLGVCASGGSALFSTRQVSAAHVGKSMTAAQVGAMWNALSTYLQSVGAPTP